MPGPDRRAARWVPGEPSWGTDEGDGGGYGGWDKASVAHMTIRFDPSGYEGRAARHPGLQQPILHPPHFETFPLRSPATPRERSEEASYRDRSAQHHNFGFAGPSRFSIALQAPRAIRAILGVQFEMRSAGD